MLRQSRFSGDQYWTNILYQLHGRCIPPVVTLPLNESLANGNYTGCLQGTAKEGLDNLILTEPVSDTHGLINYAFSAFQPVLTVSFDFSVSEPSIGNGADGVFFYFNASEVPLTEDAGISGYVVGFSEYHGLSLIRYANNFFHFTPFEIQDNVTYSVTFTFNAGAYSIYVDGELVTEGTDPNYNTRVQDGHNLFGLGARCGAQHAKHVVSNFSVSPGFPMVTTDSLVMPFAQANPTGTVVVEGSSDLTEYGFIWSRQDNPNPINGGTKVVVGNSAFTGTYSATFGVPLVDTYMYVASYATNEAGTSYGAVLRGTITHTP